MSKRLVKVAAELNVGTKTIVEFLTGNGFEVMDRPTAKISEEMYNVLVQNFQKSIAIKEKAEKITIGSRVNNKKEEKPKKSSEKTKEETSLFKETKEKAKEVVKEEVKEKEEPKEEKKEEIVEEKSTVKGPKILGKIDLNSLDNKGKRKSKKKEETPKDEKEAKKEPKKEVKKEEPKKEETPKDENKEQKEETKEEKKPKSTKKKEEVKDTKEEKKKVSKKKEEPVEKEPEQEEEAKGDAKSDKTETKEKDDKNIETKAPQLKGLKILGKINIEDPKSKKKKKKEKEDKRKKEKGEKEEENSSKKKRRKRTKISKGENNNNDNKQGDGRNKKRRKRKKRKEISEKEVDEKLKETMARVQGSGNKKNKKYGSTRSARDEKKEQERLKMEEEMEEDNSLQVTEFISVSELAGLLDISAADIITMCMQLGQFVSINQRLDAEMIELIASEYGKEVEFISAEDQIDIEEEEEVDDPKDLEPRAPIVTVMGHVDHGKTSLLDYIRKANVASGEAGGITQHIGAYEVKVGEEGHGVTFLDTPGHEAFTAMRARGAKVTDIAVIIISADDSVMPQTREAISHAQAANVPIIFAINKIDKEGANPDKIKQELASMNLLIEEWGGPYQCQEISAKKGLNIDLLLEKIVLESELLELKANPKRRAVGAILEASLEKGRGYVAKILIQTGTLKIGDPIIAGQHSGRVKAMLNERGERVKEAGPSTPVLVLGLDGAPQAGEKLQVLESERDTKELANKRAQIIRQQQIRATRRITLDEITRRMKVGNFQELNLIVKGDMDGSVEALADSLLKLSTEQVQTNIIYKAVGPITESDVNLAAASDAIIVGFQVRPNPMARTLAEQEGIEIKTYSIIYDAIEEIKSALEGLLEPKQVEEVIGMVEIQQVFHISKVGAVAGCMVQEGRITRNSFIRIIRDGIVIYPKKEGVHGELSSLKRFKDNVKEVKNGFECGLTIRNFDKIQEGDEIEVYEMKEVKQTLE